MITRDKLYQIAAAHERLMIEHRAKADAAEGARNLALLLIAEMDKSNGSGGDALSMSEVAELVGGPGASAEVVE